MNGQTLIQIQQDLLTKAYAAFNARDIDSVLALMHSDVEWANGMEGGYVRGHQAVRDYWTRQWTLIDWTLDKKKCSRNTYANK
ncbi:MAG: nuclear transport factor 2 family protein [Nostoc sp.]|uniref:nuclear transport factor 2 family protein n=1 Tax=Nostoc sp. TaxID=1180 RepID=UPI002FF7A127